MFKVFRGAHPRPSTLEEAKNPMTLSRSAVGALLGASILAALAPAMPSEAAALPTAPHGLLVAAPAVKDLTIRASDQRVEAGKALDYVFTVESAAPSSVGSYQTWGFASGLPEGFTLAQVDKNAGTWRLATTRELKAGEGPFTLELKFYDGFGTAAKRITVSVGKALEASALDLLLDQDSPFPAGTKIFTATGGSEPYAVSITDNGGISDLVISPDGTAAGTAPSPGSVVVAFTITDAGGASRALKARVTSRDTRPPLIEAAETIDAMKGEPFTAPVKVSDNWSVPVVSLDPASTEGVSLRGFMTGSGPGSLEGRIDRVGEFTATIRAVDSVGNASSRSVVIRVKGLSDLAAPSCAPRSGYAGDEAVSAPMDFGEGESLPDKSVFSLPGEAPSGASIDPASGLLTWAIPEDFPASEVKIPVRVDYRDGTRDELECRVLVKKAQALVPLVPAEPIDPPRPSGEAPKADGASKVEAAPKSAAAGSGAAEKAPSRTPVKLAATGAHLGIALGAGAALAAGAALLLRRRPAKA